MVNKEQKQTLTADFIKILFLMYIVTFVLLFLLAFVLFKTDATELVCKIWLISVYIISGFMGGFLIGKRTKNKKFLWGFFVGLIYFVILFVASMILHRGGIEDWTHMVTTMILCVTSSLVGGMVS